MQYITTQVHVSEYNSVSIYLHLTLTHHITLPHNQPQSTVPLSRELGVFQSSVPSCISCLRSSSAGLNRAPERSLASARGSTRERISCSRCVLSSSKTCWSTELSSSRIQDSACDRPEASSGLSALLHTIISPLKCP